MRGVIFFNILLTLVASIQEETACYLPIDVVFLQDTTGSFVADLPNVVAQIPNMTAQILDQNPESFWAVSEFRDKPYWPLGEHNDFCYKLHSGLQPDVSKFRHAFSQLHASGGGDLPEAQFQALLNIALDPAVGWRPLRSHSQSREVGTAGARLVILSTDASVHLAGDMTKMWQYPEVPQDLPANPGNIDVGIEKACSNYDYPDGYQVKAALEAMDIMLAILTPNVDQKVVGTWKWINEDLLEQPADFYQFIATDSSDLIDGVLRAVKAVTEYTCLKTTTTTTSTVAVTLPQTTVIAPTIPESTVVPTIPESTITTQSPTTTTTTTTTTTISTTTITPEPSTTVSTPIVYTSHGPSTTTTTPTSGTTTTTTTILTNPNTSTTPVTRSVTGSIVTYTPTESHTRLGTNSDAKSTSDMRTRHPIEPLPATVNFSSDLVHEFSREAANESTILDEETYVSWRPLPWTATEYEPPTPPPCCPALKIEVNGEPKKLLVEYIGPDSEELTEETGNNE